jgi:crotonobetainyl-CoA:carnitine CoA-transferase CaiB-like acyl-CoA transferase
MSPLIARFVPAPARPRYDPVMAPRTDPHAEPVGPASAPGPLAGIVVADCSTVLAGPYCTMLLGDLGADVVKIEPPEGDGTRAWGPPWVGAGRLGPDDPGVAAYYLAVNRNKRSLRLDLKTEPGREVLRRLVARADVLVENFRVGGFAGLGFGDDVLEALNPRLVHLAISGYGPTGPEAAKPGYDFVIQAVSGLMSITGWPDKAGGEPTKVGVAIADVVTGLHGAVAVLAALAGRNRAPADGGGGRGAGRGQRIDVSILESALAVLVNQAQNAFATGIAPVRRGNAHPNIVPYETFATADGEIAVAVGSERQWERFCDALGVVGLATDPRFATNAARVAARDELRPILAERLAAEGSAYWLARLESAEVPSGPINDLVEAFATDQVRAREMVVDVEHPRLGRVRQVGPPFRLGATPASIRSAPPLLGEQADELLAELGYTPSDVARLRADGVV